jgi:hypothetical protein
VQRNKKKINEAKGLASYDLRQHNEKHSKLLSSISSHDSIPCAFYRFLKKPQTPFRKVSSPKDATSVGGAESTCKKRNAKSVTT